MPVRVRFAPSPTGSLHLGNALTAIANRRFADENGGVLVLRIDDTDPSRTIAGGQEAILDDLAWLGVAFDEGPFLVGTLAGTYSSLMIASPIVLWWHKGQRPKLGASQMVAEAAPAARS